MFYFTQVLQGLLVFGKNDSTVATLATLELNLLFFNGLELPDF